MTFGKNVLNPKLPSYIHLNGMDSSEWLTPLIFLFFCLEETVVLKIAAKDYLGKLAGDGNIKLYVKAKVDETKQSYVKQDIVEIIKPTISVTVGSERTTNVTWGWSFFYHQSQLRAATRYFRKIQSTLRPRLCRCTVHRKYRKTLRKESGGYCVFSKH